jgi:H+-transporting ATPase
MHVHGDVAVQCDQRALTGESLPVKKDVVADLLSGSTVREGECQSTVTATGTHAFIGKAVDLVQATCWSS